MSHKLHVDTLKISDNIDDLGDLYETTASNRNTLICESGPNHYVLFSAGTVCDETECTATNILESTARSASSSNGCIHPTLENNGHVCVSTVEIDTCSIATNQEKENQTNYPGNPVVADTVLVPDVVGDETTEQANVLPTEPEDNTSRMAIIRRIHQKEGLSEETVEYLIGAQRVNTQKAYNNGWNLWCINTIRSSIASVFKYLHPNQTPIATQPLAQDFFSSKRKHLMKIPEEHELKTWDIDVVINYIKETFPIDTEISLTALQQKTIFLMCIATMAKPRSDIGNLQFQDVLVQYDPTGSLSEAILHFRQPKEAQIKTCTIGIAQDTNICSATTLINFTERTATLRSRLPQEHTLFLAYIEDSSKTCSARSGTVANWAKNMIQKAGIDTTKYRPHTTCSAASTKAIQKGHTIEQRGSESIYHIFSLLFGNILINFLETSSKRSTIKLIKAPKTASIIFKEIFEIYSALRNANHQYTVSAIVTLGDYASSAQSNLSDFVHQGDNNESDGEEKEEEKKEEDDGEDNEKGEQSMNILVPDKTFNFYTSILKTHAQQRLLKNEIFSAASLVCQKELDVNETELLKLCLSHIVNLLDHNHVTLYTRFIPASIYNEILQACDQMKSLQPSLNMSVIDEIFDELLQFQFDKDDWSLLNHFDEKKFKEKNKKSEIYKLIPLGQKGKVESGSSITYNFRPGVRVVEEVVHNFKSWKIEDDKHNNYAEMTYQQKFANILDIILEDEDITVYDGEKVSKDTQQIQILNEDEDNGRKIDLLTKTKYGDVVIELCSIEFKVQDATHNISKKQQSKNIRKNISILNNVNNINNQSSNILYMDWKGRESYLVQVFQFKDIMVSYFVEDLYIPKDLMEPNDFRNTLQYLCFWRDSVVKLSNETRLAAYKEKRKYIVSDISAPFRSFDSPPKSPAQRPIKVMEQEGA
ncbi:hypothetical protein K501DRAFT_276486 [Backusella circina FSU 941]|nr:hypothetical protein K501DRAFT_276486 [Backusella circina FSU 941]